MFRETTKKENHRGQDKMSKLIIKQKFPCGYEMEIFAKCFGGIDTKGFELGVCPLHNKGCKKQEGKTK